MKTIVFIVLSLLTNFVFSQTKPKYLYFQVADKSVSLYPFYKIIDNNYYPAFSVGGEIDYIQKNISVFFQTVEITGYSHKMIGTGVTINTSIGHRFQTQVGLYAESMFGIGTTIFSPSRENYSINEVGKFELRENPLHIVLGVPLDFALGYQRNKFAFFLKYQYMIEYPHMNLLHILPTAILGIGVKYQLN